MPFRDNFTQTTTAPKLIHRYDLKTSYNDFFDGESLVPLGGNIIPAGYQFSTQQGLSLSNSLPSSSYSLLLDFSLENVDNYHKILDCKNLTADSGIYVYQQKISLFQLVEIFSFPYINANVPVRLVLVKDNEQPYVRIYLNGEMIVASTTSTFIDVTEDIIYLFQDDSSISESSSGICTQVAIFDGALSNQGVRSLGGVGVLF